MFFPSRNHFSGIYTSQPLLPYVNCNIHLQLPIEETDSLHRKYTKHSEENWNPLCLFDPRRISANISLHLFHIDIYIYIPISISIFVMLLWFVLNTFSHSVCIVLEAAKLHLALLFIQANGLRRVYERGGECYTADKQIAMLL